MTRRAEDQPHAPGGNSRVERLRAAPRCGATGKRKGTPCQSPAMKNGRCRMHGGKSTGPRTAKGLKRSRRANWKHGIFSAEEIKARKQVADLLRSWRKRLRENFKGI